jgi:hypothetical protein
MGMTFGGHGGGIFCAEYSDAVIADNWVYGNSAIAQGGGIHLGYWLSPKGSAGLPVVINNTIVDNSANYGGGLACITATAKVANTILWDNQCSTAGGEILLMQSTLDIRYSNVQGGQTKVESSNSTLNWGAGMIDQDPVFVSPAFEDYHLQHHSPCKDGGDNLAVVSTEDFEGDPRIADHAVDMGADEFHPHFYIAGDTTPGGAIQFVVLGAPGSSPVLYFYGFTLWEPPLNWWPYGRWYLKDPFFGPFFLWPPPAPGGVIVVNASIPASPPGPYTVYVHGLVGDTSTNLCILNVE